MSVEKVKAYFEQFGMKDRVIELTLEELEKYSNAKGWVSVSK